MSVQLFGIYNSYEILKCKIFCKYQSWQKLFSCLFKKEIKFKLHIANEYC